MIKVSRRTGTYQTDELEVVEAIAAAGYLGALCGMTRKRGTEDYIYRIQQAPCIARVISEYRLRQTGEWTACDYDVDDDDIDIYSDLF